MTKLQKRLGVVLAGCMLLSSLMMSATAADTTQTAEDELPFTVEAGTYCPEDTDNGEGVPTMITYVPEEDLPFTIEAGTYCPEDLDEGAMPRAVSKPTSYAPSSYYGRYNYHYWTADASTSAYTWTSYMFKPSSGENFQVFSDKSFKVFPYGADGTAYAGVQASYDSSMGYYVKLTYRNTSAGYYAKIQNTSGSLITKNDSTYYIVF